MKYAVITLSYNFQLAVPIADVSKLLSAIGSATRVDSHYQRGSGEVYFVAQSPDSPRVVLIDSILPAKPAEPESEA